ncbi:MmcQ/YjbR family DNA-binding protein [Solimonas terrae]|uniref:MmcQ/YjbR family DNA-binding protein n=1 Tax=Solimonas terrae TaxID=1396819 RepID=A0A6M2BMX9_9GAMM|nr:MmcQ/YjbR family DNA-binding protein [Solimonas terrae]NGY03581.1 MmcQ/YjbR family DNA-binding protein [Solimonas terrae]
MAISEAQFRNRVEAWPGVTLDVKWGDHLVASVDAKMFAMFNRADSARAGQLHFKVEDELFLALTEQPGIAPAMYLARAKWVTVVEPKRYPMSWYGERLRGAYEIIAGKLSKKRQRELGLTS